MQMISLGLSCHSRFLIASAGARVRRYPFDWNISTKRFLLDALAQDGAGFAFRRDDLAIYRLRQGGIEGLRAGEVFPWHDFRRGPDGRLPSDWDARLDAVNEKYRALWQRFAACLRSPWSAKWLILSNCQENLSEFAASDADFAEKFRLTPDFVAGLIERLEEFGARRFRLVLFLRTLSEHFAFLASERQLGERVRSRFVGVLNNEPGHNLVARSSLAAPRLWPRPGRETRIGGEYENGMRLEGIGRGRFIASRPIDGGLLPCAEATAFGDRLVFVFDGALGDVREAVCRRGGLRFASGEEWRRSPDRAAGRRALHAIR